MRMKSFAAAAVIASIAGCKTDPTPTQNTQTTSPGTATASVTAMPKPTPPSSTVASKNPEVAMFVAWAIKQRGNAKTATSEPECKPDGWCEGLCKGFMPSGAAICGVRYRKSEPQAVRFDVGMVDGPLTCADLGDSAKQRGRTAYDVGCTLASGMLAMINLRGGKSNSVFVVTPEYLAYDKDMVIP